MKYLRISNKAKLYFENIGVDCINNVEGAVYLTGSMRNITGAISKILKENKGARVHCMTTATIKIIDKKHAIVNACVIFDLSEMIDSTELEEDTSNEKKVKITDSVKLFCNNNNITHINNSEGAIYLAGSMRGITATISKILQSNEGIQVQCLTSVPVRTEKDEKGKEYAVVNACVIFDYGYKKSKKQSKKKKGINVGPMKNS